MKKAEVDYKIAGRVESIQATWNGNTKYGSIYDALSSGTGEGYLVVKFADKKSASRTYAAIRARGVAGSLRGDTLYLKNGK